MSQALPWSQADAELIWHPFTPLVPQRENQPVLRAEGCWLYLEDGRKVLDAIGSWWVNLHGHSHPAINEALTRQAQQLEHVIFAGFTHRPAVELCQGLLPILPRGLRRFFFSDNGSTAIEVALKMALQVWHNRGQARHRIVALDGAYHGDTFGAMSVGEDSAFNAPFRKHLFQVDFLPVEASDSIEGLLSPAEEESLAQFQSWAASGEVAAFIYEPLVQGASGMRFYRKAWLQALLEIARRYEIICIADEVMTGFGRLGPLFAHTLLGSTPDILCLSKGLTGGYLPMGLTITTEGIQAAFQDPDILKTFFHGHSFTANPLACAVAKASLDLLLTEDCHLNRLRIAARHQQVADELKAHPAVISVRCQGVILALTFRSGSTEGYFNEARHRLYDFFLSRGILLRPLGNVVYVLPPYVISDEELDLVYTAIRELLAELSHKG